MSFSNVAVIREAIEVIEAALGPVQAPLGLVLGSGLGGLGEQVEAPRSLSYDAIPHLPRSTVPGHAGRLIAGRWRGREVILLSGRIHAYEGHPASRVALPVHLLAAMGVDTLIVTNAAGAINARYNVGELMLIADHLNLTGGNPLVGLNDDRIGPRFPDMSNAYDAELRRLARQRAGALGLTVHEGVYASMLGPSYETPAEIRMLRALGADAVGMSTVPEVIAARHAGMRVLGLSCLTNLGAGMADEALDHGHVHAVAGAATEAMVALLAATVEALPPLAVRRAAMARFRGEAGAEAPAGEG